MLRRARWNTRRCNGKTTVIQRIEQPYQGFPRKVRQVPVPAPLLGSLLERIDDFAELKCTLRVISLLNEKRGYPRFLALSEIQADEVLARAFPDCGNDKSSDIVERALGRAVKRGTLSFVVTGSGHKRQPVFGLNTESDRAALARLADQPPSEGMPGYEPSASPVERPNIFEMYEQNIGLLSPIISDQLREAEAMYHEDWIADAFSEAVAQNKRSWRYISAILERWEREGRGYGEPGRHLKKVTGF